MKVFFTHVFEKFKNYSKKIEDVSLLTSKNWIVFNELDNSKTIYIFQETGVLLVSINGRVTKAKWEYLGNNTLLIDFKEESFLYRQGFFDENILALKIDNDYEYALLINEDQFYNNITNMDSIEKLLENTYNNILQNYNFLNETNQSNHQADKNIITVDGEEYRIIDGFKEGYAVVINENLDYGFINTNEELVLKCKYDFAENFSSGLALVRENGKFGYVDNTFNYRIKPNYDTAKSFVDNLGEVTIDNNQFKIDKEGNKVL